MREVQPVLDRHCASCHDGSQPDLPYLKGDLKLTDWATHMPGQWRNGGRFTKSYADLQRFVRRPGIEGDRRMFTPMDYHFSTTALGKLLRKGHHGVQLDPEGWERLTTWADLNAQFVGTWSEVLEKDISQVSNRALELRKRYVPMGPFPDYEAIPQATAYDPTPVAPKEEKNEPQPTPDVKGWPFDAATATSLQKKEKGGKNPLTLDLGSGVRMEMLRIPGGTFAMGSPDGHPDEQPVCEATVGPLWMGKTEVTNKQFRQFDPNHESRTEDRHGYQFGITGYEQDQPDQPAVRVSWQEAMAFCKWLSEKTGKKVTLPTEAEWEWACRAGTSTPFWYGGIDSDFSKSANLGDAMLAQFVGNPYEQDRVKAAVKNPGPYDNWIPQDARFNDGGFVTEPVGKYEPNPWGLLDMHGNAAEWTRSAYLPYPYKNDDGRNQPEATGDKVVRGGSWYDRPKCATASYRVPFAPFQRVYNVGFRVVIED